MSDITALLFADVRVDPANACLWRGPQQIKLPPKAFALLRYLAEHRGRVVSKEELLQAVWPEVVVSEAALTTCVREVRKALGEAARAPRYLETVHRRGYRFIAPLTANPQPVPRPRSKVQSPHSALGTRHSAITLVGREAELEQLHNWIEKSLNGERQMVFVTGEAGIGKTTVVETFLERIAAVENVRIGRGQCIEHYGTGEAYLPVLEALGRLCRGADGARVIEVLRKHAPMWLVQLPALIDGEELEAVQHKVQGATRERMLRELVEALEVLTAEQPLILWLEDLHWSDVSTLDWLALLARRTEPARLLVIGTYRPVELLTEGHPLKSVMQELQGHRLCEPLPLALLGETAVAAYLAARLSFPSPLMGEGQGEGEMPRFFHSLAATLHQRTGGNPLFLVSLVDDLVARGVLIQTNEGWALHHEGDARGGGVPESIRQLVARQRERLFPDEQRMLEAASAAGMEFSAAAVAAALMIDTAAVERRCERLAEHQQFLQRAGIEEWPDGTAAARYSFLHALYQQLWHERVSPTQLQQLHLRIGERKEQAYGKRIGEIATELAVHFEQGRDYRRAVQYLQQAGENATRRSANVEAISHLIKGLELLTTLPDTPERAQQELRLLTTLGPALISLKGHGAPEVEHTYGRAYELCQQGGKPLELIVLAGLAVFYLVRGEVRKARDLAEQGLRSAPRVSTPIALMGAHVLLGESLAYQGELTAAREHFEQAWGLYNPQEHNVNTLQVWVDPGVALLSDIALTSWYLGYPDQAQKRCQEFLALAAGLSHPFSLGFALLRACSLHSVRQEWQRARERAGEVMRLATELGFPFWFAEGTALQGRALAAQGQEEEGIAQLEQGLAFFRAAGTELERLGNLPWLAAAYGKVGRVEEGLAVLAEALAVVDKTGVRVHEVGLYVTQGWLLLARSGDNQVEAEACFRQAIEIARRQQAKSWELRAATSLARLWQQQGKQPKARTMLSDIYGWFTEGFDTKDLQEAKTLLEELA